MTRRTEFYQSLLGAVFAVTLGVFCAGVSFADELFDDAVPAAADDDLFGDDAPAEDEPADVAIMDDDFDDANAAADGLVLEVLPEDLEWEGRVFEEDEEEVEVVEQAIAVPAMLFRGAAPNGGKIEVDEDDPFAEILKKQPQFAAHVQQIRTGVESTLGGDLTFAARVCEATEEEREKMREAAQPASRKIMEQVAKAMRAQFGLGAFMNQRGAKSEREQRRGMVEEVLTKVYWTKKDDGQEKPEQITKWETAVKARDAYNFESNARVFVTALSDRLFLEADQRDALTKSIAEVWKDEWKAYINIMVHNPEYFPNIKSKAIKPHLSDEQYQIWKSMPKTQMGVSAWQNQGNNMFNNGQQQKNPWFKQAKNDKANGNAIVRIAGGIRAVRMRAAAVAVAVDAADDEGIDEEAVSLHNLGVLSMNSGVAIIKQAIKDGAGVDEKTAGGLTPLHVAAVNGAKKNVELLLELGADPAIKNKARETPGDLAKKHGEDEIAKLLAEALEKAADGNEDAEAKKVKVKVKAKKKV